MEQTFAAKSVNGNTKAWFEAARGSLGPEPGIMWNGGRKSTSRHQGVAYPVDGPAAGAGIQPGSSEETSLASPSINTLNQGVKP